MARALLVFSLLVMGSVRAHAMSFAPCFPSAIDVPENPSVVVAKSDLAQFVAKDAHGNVLPFTTAPLSDYFVWATVPARDGAEIVVSGVEGPRCPQFRKLRVTKHYRPDRKAALVNNASLDSMLWIELAARPAAWVRTEWAYRRDDLSTGQHGIDISGFGNDAKFGVLLPFTGTVRPLYLRITLLFPDRSVGGAWSGWASGDGGFGSGHDAPFASAAGATTMGATSTCATSAPFPLRDRRLLVDGWAQQRYRVVDVYRRSHAPQLAYRGGAYELVSPVRDVFWIRELPSGACHGPYRVSAKPAPVQVGRPTEYGDDLLAPEGIELPILAPTLRWKLRVEWSTVPWDHATPRTTRSREVSSSGAVHLAYGADVAAGAEPFVRITPLYADGSHGEAWSGRVVRDAAKKQLDLVSP